MQATGGYLPALEFLDATTGGRRFVKLEKPFAIAGRNADSDLVLDHWQVSRRHIYFQALDEGVFWIDLASRTGVRVNGSTETLGWLTYHDVLNIGSFELRLSKGPEGSPEPIRPTTNPLLSGPSVDDFPKPVVEFVDKSDKVPNWSVTPQIVLIGRSSFCKIQIKTADVSSFHCALIRTRSGLWVVDLLGGETRINQIPIRFARLEPEDELKVGKQRIRVSYDVPLPDLPPETDPVVERVSVPALIAKRVEKVEKIEEPAKMLRRLVEGRTPEQVELAESVIVPMVQQFSLLQQEMLEQFQQAMMSMFNAFGSMYQDQMAEFKQELTEIRELTTELQELQAAAAVAKSTFEKETTTSPAEKPQPEIPLRPWPTVHPGKVSPGTRPTLAGTEAQESGTHPNGTKPAGTAEPNKKLPPARDAQTSADIHSILTQRIAAIQSERQSKLQRVMQMILGER